MDSTSSLEGVEILSPSTVRTRCKHIFDGVVSGDSLHFKVDLPRLSVACNEVIAVTQQTYPDFVVPYHSRWRHFEVDGVDLSAPLFVDCEDRFSAEIELAIVSVLLDAGAGKEWSYKDIQTQQIYYRSEGLAIASLNLFASGVLSSSSDDHLRVDGAALVALQVSSLAKGFQVTPENPLVGLESRVEILNRLGQTILDQQGPGGRLIDMLPSIRYASEAISAADILQAVLLATGSIWPHRQTVGNVVVADVWPHRNAGGEGVSAGLVPFHKLSQWLTYSILEPLERQHIRVQALDGLTGLPEYRNGGLFIDTGVIQPLNEDCYHQKHAVNSEFIIEWRALTVTLLDQLANSVRDSLALSPEQLPLAAVLQGGTWSAGRKLAQLNRKGLPPIEVYSDGTVF